MLQGANDLIEKRAIQHGTNAKPAPADIAETLCWRCCAQLTLRTLKVQRGGRSHGLAGSCTSERALSGRHFQLELGAHLSGFLGLPNAAVQTSATGGPAWPWYGFDVGTVRPVHKPQPHTTHSVQHTQTRTRTNTHTHTHTYTHMHNVVMKDTAQQ